MPLMQEAMTMENFDRQEKGLPPLKPKVVKRPEPKRPNIDNEIKFEDIPIEDFVELEYAKRNTLKNEEGVRFLGYDVSMILSSTASLKRKPGRPMKDVSKEISSEPKTLTGWMQEGDFLSLIRNCRKKINPQVVNW
jgi:hypothetical protein